MSIKQKQHSELDDVYFLLSTWGAWMRAIQSPALDIVCGNGLSAAEYDSDVAERAERLLLIVKNNRPEYFAVIEQEYYFESYNADGAHFCKISVREYRTVRENAAQYFLGLMDCENCIHLILKKVA